MIITIYLSTPKFNSFITIRHVDAPSRFIGTNKVGTTTTLATYKSGAHFVAHLSRFFPREIVH